MLFEYLIEFPFGGAPPPPQFMAWRIGEVRMLAAGWHSENCKSRSGQMQSAVLCQFLAGFWQNLAMAQRHTPSLPWRFRGVPFSSSDLLLDGFKEREDGGPVSGMLWEQKSCPRHEMEATKIDEKPCKNRGNSCIFWNF